MFVVLVIFAILGVLTTPIILHALICVIKENREWNKEHKRLEEYREEEKKRELPFEFRPALVPLYVDFKWENDIFIPLANDIVFYSTEPDSFHERLIVEHLDEIKEKCKAKGRRFIYLPDLNKQILSVKQVSYYNPSVRPEELNLQISVTYKDIAELYRIPSDVSKPCFVRLRHGIGGNVRTSVYQLEADSFALFLMEIESYLSHSLGLNDYYLSIESDEKTKAWLEKVLVGKSADYRFNDDIYMLSLEIKKNVEQLRAVGVPLLAIIKLVGDISDEPSRLHISKDYKITFLDFDNQELVLSPVNKAVFLLFLNHPEGICFKDLADYKEELLDLYKKVSVYDSIETMENTVNRLIDPMDNSINEKCARIRNALMLMFREEIANWYMIKGNRGEPKGIKLPRNLVIREI